MNRTNHDFATAAHNLAITRAKLTAARIDNEAAVDAHDEALEKFAANPSSTPAEWIAYERIGGAFVTALGANGSSSHRDCDRSQNRGDAPTLGRNRKHVHRRREEPAQLCPPRRLRRQDGNSNRGKTSPSRGQQPCGIVL